MPMGLANTSYKLVCVIVDFGKGSKILKVSKGLGVSGGTFFLGKGTIKSHLLDILGLNEVRKEILIMAIEEETEDVIYGELNKRFSLDKANHGIAFSISLIDLIGIGIEIGDSNISNIRKRGVNNMEYEAIFTIVDKGLSENVVEAAKLAGSTGATVIHARGSGTSDHRSLFNFEIEPEKNIILILSTVESTENIVNSIKKTIDIDEREKGIIFVMNVSRTLGLFKN